MNLEDKEISYTTTNSYCTLNTLKTSTKNVWFVCHGMGYLSRYFLRYFTGLNPDENYIIAPQAQSKYYISPKFKHVGASWLTKENTLKETENVFRNLDAVLKTESLPENLNFIVFGYSQGVSVALRYVASRKLKCHKIIIHSGGIPNELTNTDFNFLQAKVDLVYGTKDEYLNEERIALETEKAKNLFGTYLNIHPFDGKHVVHVDWINKQA